MYVLLEPFHFNEYHSSCLHSHSYSWLLLSVISGRPLFWDLLFPILSSWHAHFILIRFSICSIHRCLSATVFWWTAPQAPYWCCGFSFSFHFTGLSGGSRYNLKWFISHFETKSSQKIPLEWGQGVRPGLVSLKKIFFFFCWWFRKMCSSGLSQDS